jgi:hypothetical protein
MTGGKPLAVLLQSSSGGNAVNTAFYDDHGRKEEVLFFYSVPDTTGNAYKTFVRNISLFTLTQTK